MRVLLAGLIVVLGAMGSSHAGEGEADATEATPESLDLKGCSACTLRHRNLSQRRKEWQAEKEARGNCQIKGDIGADGERLYHRPGEHDYEGVRISEAEGERWFCSVDEAEAAGWHAVE